MKTAMTAASALPHFSFVRPFALLIVFTLLSIYAVGCGSTSGGTEEPISRLGVVLFEFKSGGANYLSGHDPSGHGEWIVTLKAPDKFSMTKKIGEKETDRGSVKLTEDEKVRLWGMIDAVDVVNLKFPHRDASPDEVILTFRVDDNVGTHIREVLINDAREREAVVGLIEYIGTLIEKYAGEKPVLM
ncbi:MAG: hypothetical protein JW984_00255 [Deltaproteobacteria bacterium]|uniref:Uncharacterized protein n=1 Tax=Candidatus Zymogenus saltonus TaxID=2844893 RepID=A0A9D8PNA5_9DELT|nr:hypothetical protein [Candidatus Zymogenus saltonus]